MKTIIVLLCTIVYVWCATTKSPDLCKHDSDCPADDCCVHNPLSRTRKFLARRFPHRRFIFDEFMQHDHGHCRAARKENETCFPLGHDFLNPELHEFHCGCEAGLECRGTVVHESQHQIQHINPKCQQTET